jgi:hypothetical protein
VCDQQAYLDVGKGGLVGGEIAGEFDRERVAALEHALALGIVACTRHHRRRWWWLGFEQGESTRRQAFQSF